MKVKVISLPYISLVLYVLFFTRPRYKVSVYRTIGPLVFIVAFENQIHIVSVVYPSLIEQVFVFKGMPYERQLKEQQVYKTLSICVELIKSDVHLKFRLKVSSNVICRRRCQGVEYQNCSMCLCHSNIQRIT